MRKLILTILALAVLVPAFAQTRKVSGVVRDENGETLPGAIVVVKSGGAKVNVSTALKHAYLDNAREFLKDNADVSEPLTYDGFLKEKITEETTKNKKLDKIFWFKVCTSLIFGILFGVLKFRGFIAFLG